MEELTTIIISGAVWDAIKMTRKGIKRRNRKLVERKSCGEGIQKCSSYILQL